MKNFDPIDIEETELDHLLRQFVLDGGDDEFTQKTLDMNADFLFSTTEKNSPGAVRELAMIQKLEQTFVGPGNWRKFWLNGILLFLVFSAGIFIYKINSSNGKNVSQNPNSGNNNFPSSAIGTDTSDTNKNAIQIISISQNSFSAIVIDSLADSTHEEKTISQKEHFTHTNDRIPIEKNWYAGKDGDTSVANNTPGPVFSAKASPENFKMVQGTFKFHPQNALADCKQDSFSTSYYTGIPFKSGMSDMQYFNYGEYAQATQAEAKKSDPNLPILALWYLPVSMLEYADTNDVKVEKDIRIYHNDTIIRDKLCMSKIPEKAIQLATEPFYFRKYEVTNKEYREFVNWVRAANGFAEKPICTMRVDTTLVTDSLEYGGEEITVAGKKCRIRRTSVQTEDYREVYNYVFFNPHAEAVKELGKNSLYIFPDTASWETDFTFSYNEAMTNYYFWHAAYDNYPVIGVSWYQAMAFLDWKTHFHQKQLDAEHIPYEIEYVLPSDIEWELVSISQQQGKTIAFNASRESTNDWMTNLGFRYSGNNTDPFERDNYLKSLFTKNEFTSGNYITDGNFHTGVADLSHAKNGDKEYETRHFDPLGISWMDGNVSEWMMENYAQNWKPFFRKHIAVLEASTKESSKLAKELELFYDKGNATNGKLVRGANWYDERFGGKPASGRNEAGMSAKRFVNPSEQHSTIGFRYVIHVRKK